MVKTEREVIEAALKRVVPCPDGLHDYDTSVYPHAFDDPSVIHVTGYRSGATFHFDADGNLIDFQVTC